MLSNFPIRSIPQRNRKSEHGYILITLLLFVALLAIAAAAIVPTVTFQIKRDREEEMIHRGAQYTRAVRRYFKKFGRYPTRIEDLVTTNNVHYLRKAYKDPITGKDFKLLHMGDIQMSVFGGGGPPNGMAGNPGAAAGAGFAQAAAGAVALAGQQAAGQTNLNPAQPADSSNQSDTQPAPGDDTPGGPDIAGGAADTSSSSSSDNAGKPNSSGQAGFGSPSAQTFGGGPIVGVASISKAKSIRVFNKKDHYDKWQFYYDPSSDRGGLISTPNQPPLMQGSQVGQPINGQPGSGNSGSVNSGNGQANGIGNSVGFGAGGNQPNSATPQQPAQEPQQTPDQQ